MKNTDNGQEILQPGTIIKDPFVLETALINKLQYFILELGNGFTFVGRQYRITIDIKADKLTHKDIGQMDFYVRFFEDQLKQPEDNSSIGLILCTEKNRTIVKYSLLNESKQIFA